ILLLRRILLRILLLRGVLMLRRILLLRRVLLLPRILDWRRLSRELSVRHIGRRARRRISVNTAILGGSRSSGEYPADQDKTRGISSHDC
ncbi:MAG: hypothetical protein WAK55_33665, partial [Xanthobacteraceae bacterium]